MMKQVIKEKRFCVKFFSKKVLKLMKNEKECKTKSVK
jgi:hypothetical protein